MLDFKDFKIIEQIQYKYSSKDFLIEEIKTKNKYLASMYNDYISSLIINRNNDILKQSQYKSSFFHQSIAKIIGFSETDNHEIISISEYISNNSLRQIINDEKSGTKPSNWTDTKKLINIYGIASAMSYLTDNKVKPVYLTPENVFETSEFYPKLCNYGLMSFEENEIGLLKIIIPESEIISEFFDIVSFGIIVCLIMSGEHPFPDKEISILYTISKVLSEEKPVLDDKIPKAYKELILSCFQIEPHEHFVFKEIMYKLRHNQEFITDSIDKDEFDKYVNLISRQNEEEEVEENEFVENEVTDFIARKYCHPIKINTTIMNLNKFEQQEELDKSNMYSLYKIQDKETKKFYTAKIFNYYVYEENENSRDAEYIKQEIEIYSQISHPAITKYIGFSPTNFTNSYKPIIVTEYMENHSLQDIFSMESKGVTMSFWNDTIKQIIIYGIASGMSYLHSRNIIHKYLNPYNISLNSYLFPKISVLGYDILQYAAPEVITGNYIIISQKADVFSFGMILYQILTSEYPYGKLEYQDILKKIINNELPGFKKTIPQKYVELMKRCWNRDPEQRPSSNDIVKELKTTKDFISKNVNEHLYYSYINLIEKQQNGIDVSDSEINSVFEKYDIEPFYQKFIKMVISNEIKSDKINLLSLSNFKKEEKIIGSGGFGNVYLIKDKEKGITYAAKELKYMPKNLNMLKKHTDLLHEVNILSEISHPCIMKLIGYSTLNFENEEKPVIVTEYIKNGSLEQILSLERENVNLDFWNDTMRLINIYGIAIAISYLHSNDIIHLDIKPLNVLVDDFLFPKLCDFGLSKQISSDNDDNGDDIKAIIGTPSFMAPEAFNGIVTKASDVYSFAILVYEIMNKTIPYDMDYQRIMYSVAFMQRRPEFKSDIPKVYKQLIERCWNQDPEKRPTMKKVVEELKDNRDFITKNVDEKIYYMYIKMIDEQIKGTDVSFITNTLFKKYSINQIFREYEEYFTRSYESITQDLSCFEIQEEIEKGEVSTVYKIVNSKTGEIYSATISNFTERTIFQNIKKKSKEVEVLRQIKHPAIQKFIGYSIKDFNKQQKSVLIKEYCENTTLFDILEKEQNGEKNQILDETKKLIIIYGIASAMSYLYSHNIPHSNINPKNIFIDNEFHPKLNDIGYYTEPKNSHFASFKSMIIDMNRINYSFLAPEILQNKKIDEKCDIYSFSLIMYVIITNDLFYHNPIKKQFHQIFKQHYLSIIEEKVPMQYRQILKQCMSEDPKKRPTFSDIVDQLETDENIITRNIDKEEYSRYIKFIKSSIYE